MTSQMDYTDTSGLMSQFHIALAHMSRAELRVLLRNVQLLRYDLAQYESILTQREVLIALRGTDAMLRDLSTALVAHEADHRVKESRSYPMAREKSFDSIDYRRIQGLMNLMMRGSRCLVWTDPD